MGLLQAFLDGTAVLGHMWIVVASAVILVGIGCSAPFWLSRRTLSRGDFLIPGLFFVISLILRLAFLRDLFVPPYFDSVEHYRIIRNLTTALETSRFLETLPALTPTYYHLGFHILASLLALVLRADPMDVILVLGQVILAALPVPVYFLMRRETSSAWAAFFAILLAGFGWYMPGFAVNWGKYPALAGLLALEIVLGIAYAIPRGKQNRRPALLIAFLLVGTIVTALFHTRTLIIIVLSLAVWQIAGKLRTAPMMLQLTFLGLMLGAIVGLGIFAQADTQLKLVLDPYLGRGLWVTLAILALSPFAFFHFPRGFYFNLLLMAGMMAALFIPAGIPAAFLENQTLLDRPFVEMTLYLPLSFLGGLGLAGLFKYSNDNRSISERTGLYVRVSGVILLLVLSAFLFQGYDISPHDCCNFVRYDDTVALDWLDYNLPADARILVAGTALNVLPSGPSPSLVGTDAGIWIPSLTGRGIRLVSFDTDFHAESTLREMCQTQTGYIYVGSTTQSFYVMGLREKPEWYEEILALPGTQIYQVIGCKK